jgi:creatinine amidohydrolase
MQSRLISHLRPDQILAEIERCPVVYLPLGPIEWHGPHLPVGTDGLNATNAARLAAEATGGLVLPTFFWGTERERSPEVLDWLGFPPDEWIVGMDFPANSLPSLYASEEVFALLVREQIRLALKWGFELVVVISGHGADNHLEVLRRLAAEFNATSPARVLVFLPFVTNTEGIMEVGHASRIETALMLALHSETVNLEALPPAHEKMRNVDWAVVDFETFSGQPAPDRTVHTGDDPRRATAEDGRKTVELAAAQIILQVKEAIQQMDL